MVDGGWMNGKATQASECSESNDGGPTARCTLLERRQRIRAIASRGRWALSYRRSRVHCRAGGKETASADPGPSHASLTRHLDQAPSTRFPSLASGRVCVAAVRQGSCGRSTASDWPPRTPGRQAPRTPHTGSPPHRLPSQAPLTGRTQAGCSQPSQPLQAGGRPRPGLVARPAAGLAADTCISLLHPEDPNDQPWPHATSNGMEHRGRQPLPCKVKHGGSAIPLHHGHGPDMLDRHASQPRSALSP